MINIETKRLVLRNFNEKDVDDFFEYMSLESTAKYEDFEPFTYDECVDSIKRRMKMNNVMAVVLKENNKLIGDVNFSKDDDDPTYEIGYDFNEKFSNQGYATEACIAMVDYIFNKLNGRRVLAECNDDNIKSIKLLERIGMRREGHFIEDITFKNDSENNPIYVNSYLYAILKKEWDIIHTK